MSDDTTHFRRSPMPWPARVERAARSVVAVHARPRLPSSEVHWRDGLIVTTDGTVRRTEGITVTLPDGRSVATTPGPRSGHRLGTAPDRDWSASRRRARDEQSESRATWSWPSAGWMKTVRARASAR